MAEFYRTEEGSNFIENTAHQLYLRQDSKTTVELLEADSLGIGSAELAIIEGIQPPNATYTEIYMSSKTARAVVRLIYTDFTDNLYGDKTRTQTKEDLSRP